MRALILAAAALIFSSVCAWSTEKPTVSLELAPSQELRPGKPVDVTLRLRRFTDGLTLSQSDLKTVHTEKLHLLIADATLTDYQHIHPEPSPTPGVYAFTFTPTQPGGYKVWADITPADTGKQEFVPAILSEPAQARIAKTVSQAASAGGYHFSLSFDAPPARGKASMGSIRITDAGGKPVNTLQPVMGAFAHIVGFYGDFEHIVHIHPMGTEPEKPTDRGGPELAFHIEPQQAGFIKLFAQVNIGGKEIFAPFGVEVAP